MRWVAFLFAALAGWIPLQGEVTYTHDIQSLISRHCAACHRPGEAGPFALLSYEDVRRHAHEIVAVTRSRFMPPWLPDPGPFRFVGEQRLTDAEIQRIAEWVQSGMPRGDGGEIAPVPTAVQGWQLGKPDMVLRAEKSFQLPAAGTDSYWNFVLRFPGQQTRWVDGVEIRPGDKRLVHHANMLMDRDCTAQGMQSTPGAGFPGMELRVSSEAFDPDSHFLFWKPGTVATREPPGMALEMDPGTCLVLNMHLQPSGKPETVQPSVGLYFTEQAATLHPMLLELENDSALDIPAGASDFVVTDTFTLPVSVQVLAIYPHAHYLGKELSAFAVLPDGRKLDLIHIPRWDLNWQAVYRYAQTVRLPAGSKVTLRYTYDNSGANVANRHHPPMRVTGGNRAEDEMAHLWLQVLPEEDASGSDPRVLLQQALAAHQVEKDPADFIAQYNLASTLRMQGELQPSIAHYQVAVRLRPTDAGVQNGLGSVLLQSGDGAAAIPFLQNAVRLRSGYFDAHYNFALALAGLSRFGEAVEQFREAVKLKPEDAEAHANLGAALAQTGELVPARKELEEALRLKPGHALARENLEAIGGMAH